MTPEEFEKLPVIALGDTAGNDLTGLYRYAAFFSALC